MAINILKFKGDLTPSALSELEKNSEIFLDCEATGLKINRDKLSLVTIFNGNKDCFIVQPSKEYQCPNLVSLLTNSKIGKCAHYMRFDAGFLSYFLRCELKGDLNCTKIMSKISRGNSSHSLRDLIFQFAGKKIDKKLGTNTDWSKDLDLLSEAELNYCCNDVLFLPQIKSSLIKILQREKGRLSLYKQAIKWLPARIQFDLNGFEDMDVFSHS